MKTYYKVVISFKRKSKLGNIRNINETYLVNAIDSEDVKKKVANYIKEYSVCKSYAIIKSILETKIICTINNNEGIFWNCIVRSCFHNKKTHKKEYLYNYILVSNSLSSSRSDFLKKARNNKYFSQKNQTIMIFSYSLSNIIDVIEDGRDD